MNDRRRPVRLEREQVLISCDENIGACDFAQCEKIVIVGIAADLSDLNRSVQFGTAQQGGDFRRVGAVDELGESRARDDVGEFVDGVRRRDEQ